MKNEYKGLMPILYKEIVVGYLLVTCKCKTHQISVKMEFHPQFAKDCKKIHTLPSFQKMIETRAQLKKMSPLYLSHKTEEEFFIT